MSSKTMHDFENKVRAELNALFYGLMGDEAMMAVMHGYVMDELDRYSREHPEDGKLVANLYDIGNGTVEIIVHRDILEV